MNNLFQAASGGEVRAKAKGKEAAGRRFSGGRSSNAIFSACGVTARSSQVVRGNPAATQPRSGVAGGGKARLSAFERKQLKNGNKAAAVTREGGAAERGGNNAVPATAEKRQPRAGMAAGSSTRTAPSGKSQTGKQAGPAAIASADKPSRQAPANGQRRRTRQQGAAGDEAEWAAVDAAEEAARKKEREAEEEAAAVKKAAAREAERAEHQCCVVREAGKIREADAEAAARSSRCAVHLCLSLLGSKSPVARR